MTTTLRCRYCQEPIERQHEHVRLTGSIGAGTFMRRCGDGAIPDAELKMLSKWVLGVHRLPDYMREAVVMYIAFGVEPGSFLLAVLSNDLREACARADDTNQRCLFDYVAMLYSDAPSPCWGSKEAVRKWVASGGMFGDSIVQG